MPLLGLTNWTAVLLQLAVSCRRVLAECVHETISVLEFAQHASAFCSGFPGGSKPFLLAELGSVEIEAREALFVG
jgi:hypothetical protein